MAFNFLGTINSLADYKEFEEFVNKELVSIDKRIAHISVEKKVYQEILDKLLIADLNLRSPYVSTDLPDKDWIKIPRQSIPEVNNVTDATTGEDVNLLKKMFLDAIKSKREKNEFMVKKIRDLVDQMNNEINFLNNNKTTCLETLTRIGSKFFLPQFNEVTEFSKEDEIGVKNISPDFGLIQSVPAPNQPATKQYMVKAINSLNNSIVFERAVPPVKKGDTFTLANGNNNGIKTVMGFLSVKTVVVIEPLNQETPSQSVAVFKI